MFSMTRLVSRANLMIFRCLGAETTDAWRVPDGFPNPCCDDVAESTQGLVDLDRLFSLLEMDGGLRISGGSSWLVTVAIV